jgi:hypothetical protein
MDCDTKSSVWEREKIKYSKLVLVMKSHCTFCCKYFPDDNFIITVKLLISHLYEYCDIV